MLGTMNMVNQRMKQYQNLYGLAYFVTSLTISLMVPILIELYRQCRGKGYLPAKKKAEASLTTQNGTVVDERVPVDSLDRSGQEIIAETLENEDIKSPTHEESVTDEFEDELSPKNENFYDL
ncbi:MAG: hypothetical protein MHPSP_003383 [Paramarteilia canceri]